MYNNQYPSVKIPSINLSQKEMEDAVQLAKSGDVESTNKVISSVIRFIIKQARKYARPSTFDDLVQEGIIGLMTAIEKWSPEKSKGASFLTYASYWIRCRMMFFVERLSVVYRPPKSETDDIAIFSMDAPMGEMPDMDSWHEVTRIDGKSPDVACMDRIDGKTVLDALRSIPDDEREAIVIVLNLNCEERPNVCKRAIEMSITNTTLYNRAERGIKKIRKRIESGTL